MILKNRIRLFSGVTAVALGFSLCTACGHLDQKADESLSPSIYETLNPNAIGSSSPTLEEEKIPVYKINVVKYTNPETGLEEIVFMKSYDSWPELSAAPEEHINFAKAKLGSTAMASKIDEAYNRAVVIRYRALKDPSIRLESQKVLSIIRDEDSSVIDIGQYGKDTIYLGATSYDTVETYVYTEKEEKENTVTVTYYDEMNDQEPIDKLMPIVTQSLILDYGMDPQETYTEKDYLDFERTLNAQLNNESKTHQFHRTLDEQAHIITTN